MNRICVVALQSTFSAGERDFVRSDHGLREPYEKRDSDNHRDDRSQFPANVQYVNPMAINCWAIKEIAPDLRTVGLCHSVQHTAAHLADCLGENIADINYLSAGINHIAFFLKYEKCHPDGKREDLYPRLMALAAEGRVPSDDRVRFDVLKRLGHFVTESSEHFSEYTSWYIKEGRSDLVEQFNIPLDEYIRRCEVQITEWHSLRRDLEGGKPIEVCRSNEYAAGIIHAAVTGQPALIYGNVPNNGLVENLPGECIVEVPCHVDRNGIQPIRIGRIPSQLAAVMRLSTSVQELTVEAALTKNGTVSIRQPCSIRIRRRSWPQIRSGA